MCSDSRFLEPDLIESESEFRMMQRVFASSKSIIPQIGRFPQKARQCRALSGHGGGHGAAAGHDHGLHKLDPYPHLPEPAHPEVAYLFNIKPGDELEGWEIPVFVVYAVCTVILVVGVGYCKSDDSFTVRANLIFNFKQHFIYLNSLSIIVFLLFC